MKNSNMIAMKIPQRESSHIPPLPQAGAHIHLDVDEFGGRRARLDIKTEGYAIGALATGIEAVAEELGVAPMDLLRAVKLVIRTDLMQDQMASRTSEAVRRIMEVF